jgi:hypothetical protein
MQAFYDGSQWKLVEILWDCGIAGKAAATKYLP